VESERAAVVTRVGREEARASFDLTTGPLIRCTLIKEKADEHILVLVMHHIVSDGWSMGVLVRELTALYEAYLEGRESPLAELPVQYADYAVWQREWLQGEALDKQLRYWRERLEGVAVLELPTDHPRPAVQRYRGNRQTSVIERSVSAGLHELAKREGATLFMVLLAGWQALLSRYSGQEDICVGTPIAGRGRRELEGLIGFFINTLVMRAHVDGAESFRELVGQVREASLGAYAHQELPFEKLVEELQPERDASRNPLFQVMFVLQNAPRESLELPGLKLSGVNIDNGTSKFDLTMLVNTRGEDLSASVEYNKDLFDDATIERLLGHFETLLAGIVANPSCRLRDLPLLKEEEHTRLLHDWNSTAREYPLELCFHQHFEEQVRRTPGAVAVVCEGESLTYAELNSRANKVGRALMEAGVGSEEVVALLGRRSIEFLISMLGVLKAGGAYLPLDPLHPAARLSQILGQSEARIILLTDEFRADAQLALEYMDEGVRPVMLCVEELIRRVTTDENLAVRCLPDNLAYVIYTSGST
ncbi:MAG: condensation domain-containing protein, partial [Pyrinomonadaceae bacterium]